MISDGGMTSSVGSIKSYIIEDEIGRGTSGRVFKARSRTSASQIVSIKFIAKKRLSKAAKDNLVNEIRQPECIARCLGQGCGSGLI
jgi:serine/threonine protein kinase